MRDLVKIIWAHVGYRGTFLLLLGGYDIFFGLYLYGGGSILHALLISEKTWGITWITVGVILLTGVPFREDRIQFAAGVFIKTAWALEYVRLAFITSLPYLWARAAYWIGFALIVLLVSAWPEHKPRRIAVEVDDVITRAENETLT